MQLIAIEKNASIASRSCKQITVPCRCLLLSKKISLSQFYPNKSETMGKCWVIKGRVKFTIHYHTYSGPLSTLGRGNYGSHVVVSVTSDTTATVNTGVSTVNQQVNQKKVYLLS